MLCLGTLEYKQVSYYVMQISFNGKSSFLHDLQNASIYTTLFLHFIFEMVPTKSFECFIKHRFHFMVIKNNSISTKRLTMFSNRLCISDVISMHIDANCLMNRYGNQFFLVKELTATLHRSRNNKQLL